MFDVWFRTATRESDLILSISRATMGEVDRIAKHVRRSDFFDLGAEFSSTQMVHVKPSHKFTAFLVVGTVDLRKGHVTILDAFEKLWEMNRDVRLVVVGKAGWLEESLIDRMSKLASSTSQFSFFGYVSDLDLNDIYREADVVITASLAEGFGLPLVEALRLGKPIIASDIAAFREVGGDLPIYFRAGDADSLIKAVELVTDCETIRTVIVPHWLTWSQSADALIEKVDSLSVVRSS